MSDEPRAARSCFPSAFRIALDPRAIDGPRLEAARRDVDVQNPAAAHPSGEGSGWTGMDDRCAEAVADIVPALLCGEESALYAFAREGSRLDEAQMAESARLMYTIAAEEAVHETLLQRIVERLPAAPEAERTRARARRFFMRIASRDPVSHFTRIATLDAALCVILSAVTNDRSRLAGVPAVRRTVRRILADESRHVRVCRSHVQALGGTRPEMIQEVRVGLVELLAPLGGAFERLDVDADRLFERIRRGGRSCEPGM